MGVIHRHRFGLRVKFVAALLSSCAAVTACASSGGGAAAHRIKVTERLATATTLALTTGTRAVAMGWSLIAVTHNHRRIELSFSLSPCGRTSFDHVGVEESSARVVVTVYGRKAIDTSGPCPASLVIALGYVELDEPLGGRPLVHGQLT
jgi:hypothetical protein